MSRVRALLLDLDGVVYLGHRLLPGVARAIRALRARGYKVLFVTNNGNNSRAGFAAKLTRLGVPCATGELMNAAWTAARRLKARHPRGTRFYVFGRNGLAAELEAAGFRAVTVHTREEWERFRGRRERIAGVVVNFDASLTWWDLCAAHTALVRGAKLIACNLDVTYPDRGGVLPGSGSLVKLLETSAGAVPELIGKPSPVMFRTLLAEHRVAPREALVVGDRLDIDIAAGRAVGARTALVLTGVDTRRDVARSRFKPDVVVRSVPDLLSMLPPLPPPGGRSSSDQLLSIGLG